MGQIDILIGKGNGRVIDMGKCVVLMGMCMILAAVGFAEDAAEAQAVQKPQTETPALSPMAQRAEKLNEAIRLERLLRGAWTNPKYTSDEIAALRKRLQELQTEQERIMRELREKVETVPEVQAVRMQINLLRAEANALAKQAEADDKPAAPQGRKETETK